MIENYIKAIFQNIRMAAPPSCDELVLREVLVWFQRKGMFSGTDPMDLNLDDIFDEPTGLEKVTGCWKIIGATDGPEYHHTGDDQVPLYKVPKEQVYITLQFTNLLGKHTDTYRFKKTDIGLVLEELFVNY